jgi:hypothetical protein
MSSRSVDQSVAVRQAVGTHLDWDQPTKELADLSSLAIQSLKVLFDEKERLFSRRIVWTERGCRREGISRCGTMIALLGLQRLEESGEKSGFDLGAIQEAVLQDTSWVKSARDLGLLLWFTAVCVPGRLSAVLDDFDLDAVLRSSADSRRGQTEGLAWFLAGIAHAGEAGARPRSDLIDVAVAAYHKLLHNQSENGLFRHLALPHSLREIFSHRFGTFADQMYAVYALTAFAREFEIEEPLESALACANSVCALQGDEGQWWFLYNTRRGCVANRYPVYSVHQDGTGPTALLALEEATGQSFRVDVWKGLSYTAGKHELSIDTINLDQVLIWDSMEAPQLIMRHWETACRYLHISRAPLVKKLSVRYEARPDHFGWMLYAFGKFRLS